MRSNSCLLLQPAIVKSADSLKAATTLSQNDKTSVKHGAACSYCLGKAQRLDGSYLRTFALELKEQLAQTLATFVTSILAGPHRRLKLEEAAEPPLRQIIEVLQQVMCIHDTEKLAISVLEIYEAGYRGETLHVLRHLRKES